MKSFLLTFTALLLLTFMPDLSGQSTSNTQPALITFYSRPKNVGYPFHQLQGFNGALFKDDQQIASFKSGRFITFQVAPGSYVFSATPFPSKDVKKGVHLPLTLTSGEHTYVEAVIFTSAALSIQTVLKEVTCEAAQADNVGNGRLDPKYLTKGQVLPYLDESQLAACTKSDTP